MFKQYKGLRKELYVLFFGRVMTNLGSMIWPMLTLILNKKLGMNANEVANCLLVFSLLALPVSLLGGKLTDKLNKKNIIVICDLLSVFFYLICGFIPLSFLSIILIAIAALLQTSEWPAYDALVSDFTLPSDRQRAYSLSYFGANLGLMLSPTIGGLLFNNYLNIAFIINGLAILSSTCLIFFLIKNVNREESEDDVNEYEKDLDNNANSFKYIFTNKVLVFYLIACVLYELAYHQFSFLVPLEMGRVFGDNGSIIYGTLSSMNCITVVLLTAFLTRILNRVLDINKCMLGCLSVIIGLIIFGTLSKYPFMNYVAVVVFTIGEIISTLGQKPFISKRIPANYRGRINSIINVIGNVTISIMTKVVGNLYDTKGNMLSWGFIYIIGLISIIAYLLLRSADKKEYPALYK